MIGDDFADILGAYPPGLTIDRSAKIETIEPCSLIRMLRVRAHSIEDIFSRSTTSSDCRKARDLDFSLFEALLWI